MSILNLKLESQVSNDLEGIFELIQIGIFLLACIYKKNYHLCINILIYMIFHSCCQNLLLKKKIINK